MVFKKAVALFDYGALETDEVSLKVRFLTLEWTSFSISPSVCVWSNLSSYSHAVPRTGNPAIICHDVLTAGGPLSSFHSSSTDEDACFLPSA